MVRIGNQTSFGAEITEPFEFAVEHGFDAFEWFPDRRDDGSGWDESQIGGELRSEIRRLARRCDVAQSVHAPWWLNPVLEEAETRLGSVVSFAKDIGATLINVHLMTDTDIQQFASGLIPLVQHLSRLGIVLAIENTHATGPDQFNELFGLLRSGLPASALEHIGMCFDLGHANIYHETQNDYLAYFDRLDEGVPLVHVHAHENYGDRDSHLVLFSGPAALDATGLIGFVDRLRARDYAGSVILEQWPDPPKLLLQARQRLRSLFHDSTDEHEGLLSLGP
jgi:sugar phosphate isomerase/epimerase